MRKPPLLKTRSIDRAVVYGWIILLVIPFLVMGWTIGRYGPGSDGWTMLDRLYHGLFIPTDRTRPLTYVPRVLMWLISGGSVPVIEVLYCLLESLGAALFFEVFRRVFTKWLGRIGVFAALLTADEDQEQRKAEQGEQDFLPDLFMWSYVIGAQGNDWS